MTDSRGAPDSLLVGYRIAWTALRALVVPAALVMVPLGLVGAVGYVLALGDDGGVGDGVLVFSGAGGPRVVAFVTALGEVALLAGAVAIGACVIMVAGRLFDRPVGGRAALRLAIRRVPTLAAIMTFGLLTLTAAVVAAVAPVAWGSGAVKFLGAVVVYPALVGVAFLLLPQLLAVPAAVLDGQGPVAAVATPYRLVRERGWSGIPYLAIGALMVPGLLSGAPGGILLRPYEFVSSAPMPGPVFFLLVWLGYVVAVPFQAAVSTVAYVGYRADAVSERGTAARRRIEETLVAAAGRPAGGRLAAGAPGTRWGRAILSLVVAPAMVLLPGLAYVTYTEVRPAATDRMLSDARSDRRSDTPSNFKPFPVELHLPPDGRAVLVRDFGGGTIELSRCVTRVCRKAAASESEAPLGVGRGVPPRVGSTILPGWVGDEAATALHRGIPVIAHAPTDPGEWRRVEVSVIRLTSCADPGCRRSSTVEVARVPLRVEGQEARPLALGVRSDGRPVIAHEDSATGAITVVACDTRRCGSPRVSHLGPRSSAPRPGGSHRLDGIDLAIPPDGRPVIAYRDVGDGTARLLRCHDPDCTAASGTALTDPAPKRPRPALVLDPRGTPLVATYDFRRKQVVLIACRDPACVRRSVIPVASFEYTPGYLDLVLGADLRPWIAWHDLDLHLTSCARPRCGAA